MAEIRAIRTLPPWIESYHPQQERISPHSHEPRHPPAALHPHHNSQPSAPPRSASSANNNTRNTKSSSSNSSSTNTNLRGQRSPDGYEDSSQEKLPLKKRRRNLQQLVTRKYPSRWDHLRSAEPVIVPTTRALEAQPSWREYIASSRYSTHLPNEHSEIVSEDVLDRLQPGLNKSMAEYPPPGSSLDSDAIKLSTLSARRRPKPPPFLERLFFIPVRHPLGPLFCRLTVLSTSIVALALASTMVTHNMAGDSEQRGQAIFAVAVDTVAIPYIGYIAWDDNMGKPLGLRPPKERVRLILTDLFFIMFKAASTGLAFETLIYRAGHYSVEGEMLRTLASFELIGLVSWAMTLIANVFRVVERLGG